MSYILGKGSGLFTLVKNINLCLSDREEGRGERSDEQLMSI